MSQQDHKLMILIKVLCLSAVSRAITIPLNPMIERCMIGYTTDSYSTLKLDLLFPDIPGRQSNEGFLISIHNTETKKTEYDNTESGSYKKQLDLDENAIYRFCFKAMTTRQVGPFLMQYVAQIDYAYTPQHIKLPESLIKNQDLGDIYQVVSTLEGEMDRYQQGVQKQKNQQMLQYTNFIDKNSKVVKISILEVVVILVIGFYQFFTIRKFLIDKQYM